MQASFNKFLYDRIKIWLRNKHPKASTILLNNQYMLLGNIKRQHNLDSNADEAIWLKIFNNES